MVLCVTVTIIVLLICLILILLIRNNIGKQKLKKEYGKVIQAKVISWDVIPGRPNRYITNIEYEKEGKKESKMLVTSGSFAKKYEHEKNIQIVTVPNSNKIFFAEEDWKAQNIILFIFLIIVASFLIQLLLIILCNL